jgi:hypothetical protein
MLKFTANSRATLSIVTVHYTGSGLTAANLSAFLYWWGSTTPSENGDNEGLIEINGSSVIPWSLT